MRRTHVPLAVCVVAWSLAVASGTPAQPDGVSIDLDQVPLRTVLESLRQSHGVAYSLLPEFGDRKISIILSEADMATAMTAIAAAAGLEVRNERRMWVFTDPTAKRAGPPTGNTPPQGSPLAAAAAFRERPWSMFMHDPAHTCRSPFTGPQTASFRGELLRLDDLPNVYDTGRHQFGMAMSAEGVLYITRDGWLIAVAPNAQGECRASVMWSYVLPAPTVRIPAVALDGTIYAAAGSDLCALSPDGKLKWQYHHPGPAEFGDPIVGYDGRVYLGWGADLVAVDPGGELAWTRNLLALSTPLIAPDGTLFTQNGRWCEWTGADGTHKGAHSTFHTFTKAAYGDDGTLYLPDLSIGLAAHGPDGALRWQAKRAGDVLGVGGDGTIYVRYVRPPDDVDRLVTAPGESLGASPEGSPVAVTPDGQPQWGYTPKLPPPREPGRVVGLTIAADGTVYCGYHQCIAAINPDGSEKWLFAGYKGVLTTVLGSQIPTEFPTSALLPPIIAPDGALYIYGCGQVGETILAFKDLPNTR